MYLPAQRNTFLVFFLHAGLRRPAYQDAQRTLP